MGPIGVGKGTVAKIIAERTGKAYIDLDEQRARLYAETDYSDDKAEQQYLLQGIRGWYRYQKPYELYSVKRILEESRNSVIAFGGGQSVYEDEDRKREFLQMMAPVAYSFLLLPYPDLEASLALLSQRIGEDEMTLNRLLVGSETSLEAAKHVLFVGEKTPDEIADEMMGILGHDESVKN
jgi:shikimate kinase